VTYDEAAAAVRATIDAERADARIAALGVTRFLDAGPQSARCVVLYHGLTNCPQQMTELGAMLHEKGWTVLIPRLPYHGYADRMTKAIGALRADELEACAARSYELAQALAPRVDVAGISLGAVLAAWLAQFRAVGAAVALSPFLGLPLLPAPASDLLGAAMRALPPLFVWWDPRVRANAKPDYAYPWFATTALGACLGLGSDVRAAAKREAPQGVRLVVATNAQEPACNNALAAQLVRRWRAHGAAVETAEFADVGRRHDIVDPQTFPAARTLVYPRVVAWLH
jgi:hypothetical protein